MTGCYSCHQELSPETEGGQTPEQALANEQWDNALIIVLEGGYGMFVDPPFDDRTPDPAHGLLHADGRGLKVVICHDCAHALCDAVPFMAKLIDPLNSHAHPHPEDSKWDGHHGWDLDRRREAAAAAAQ